MSVCIVLLWVVVPVAMVRLGYKEAGRMVVREGDKAPDDKGEALNPEMFKPRVEEIPKVRVLEDSQFVPRAPTPPKQDPLKQ